MNDISRRNKSNCARLHGKKAFFAGRLFRRGGLIFLAVFAQIAGCTLEGGPNGDCGDLDLGYGVCQCTAPNDTYSKDSLNSRDPTIINFEFCGDDRKSYFVELKPDEV